MSDFDLALRFTADGSEAVEESRKVGGALDGVDSSVENLTKSSLELEAAQARAASAAAALAVAEEKVGASAGKTAGQQAAASAGVLMAKSRLSLANENLRKTQQALNDAGGENVRSLQKQGYAIRNTGQQVGDFVTQGLAPGIGFMRSFSQQAGQMGYALSEFEKGPLKKVGDFLVGPWGIALTVAAMVVGKLVENMEAADEAARKNDKSLGLVKMTTEELIKATNDLAAAQDQLGKSTRQRLAESKAYAAYLYIQADAARVAAKAAYEHAIALLQESEAKVDYSGDDGIVKGASEALLDSRIGKLKVSMEKLTAATETNRQSYRRAKADFAEFTVTTEKVAAAQDRYKDSINATKAAYATGAIQEKERDRRFRDAKASLEAVENADKNAAKATREHNKELREQAKAAREAAKEADALARTVERLTEKYGNKGKAQADIRQDMAEIARLSLPKIGKDGTVTPGTFSPGQGLEMSANAGEDLQKLEAERMKKLMEGMFPDVPTMQQQIEAANRVKEAERELAEYRENEAIAGIQALGGVLDEIFGGGFGGKVGGLLQRVTAQKGKDGMTDDQRKMSAGLEKLGKGIGLSDEAAGKIGKIGGKAFAGAQTGALANEVFKPLADALGVKTSKTGAKIGGAIGGMTGIPGGDIIGSIIGSVVGGLFKKTKQGGVTLTSATDAGTTFGNSGVRKEAAEGLAGAVQQGLQSIADQLGGQLGGFNLTIGQRGKDYRVNVGGTSLKTGKGAKDFGDDADAAAAYAIQQAIIQGAVTGLSAAVQRALASSDDVNKALAEALKVQEVEDLVKGMGDDLNKEFRALEKQYAERLRIAKEYGFDVAKIEEQNQKDRLAAVENAIKDRVGSLQSLLDDFTYGDLFQGSATDRRSAILEQIAQQKKLADAGDPDAINQLSGLYRQLVETTKDAFGTAGPQFGADINTARSGAAQIIAQERDRIMAQQKAQEDALKAATKQNELADETNNLLADQKVILQQIANGLASLGVSGGVGALYDVTGRTVQI